jgi:hypothetical protein
MNGSYCIAKVSSRVTGCRLLQHLKYALFTLLLLLSSTHGLAFKMTEVARWRSGTHLIAQSGNYAYLVDGVSGLQIINVSNPANPFLAGSYFDSQKMGYPFEIAVAGNYVCTLDYYSNDLQVFSISNPTNPVLLGTCAFANTPRRLAVSGNYACVTVDTNNSLTATHMAGMSIVNLAVPNNPVIVATYWTTNLLDPILWIQGGGVAVANNYAYMTYAGKWYDPEFHDTSFGDMKVINVSNPSNPIQVGGVMYGYYESWDVALSGNYAFATYHWAPRPPTYPVGLGGLAPINISNPSQAFWPVDSNHNNIRFETGQNHLRVAVAGNYAWLVGGSPNLRVIDIRNPTNMVLAAAMDISVDGIALSEHYAYLVMGGDLRIFCIDCPSLSAGLDKEDVVLKWPASATNYALESATSLPAIQWQPVLRTPVLNNGFYQLSVSPTSPAVYFRLRGQ